jgi:hypothetical protein
MYFSKHKKYSGECYKVVIIIQQLVDAVVTEERAESIVPVSF